MFFMTVQTVKYNYVADIFKICIYDLKYKNKINCINNKMLMLLYFKINKQFIKI